MNVLIPTLIIGVMGLSFGLLLGYASKVFAVKVDERVVEVRALLPGANCGGCGNPSCDAFAALLVEGKANPNGCAVNGEQNRLAIGALLGMTVEKLVPTVSVVLCQGTTQHSPPRFRYDGLQTCKAASAVSGGPKHCAQGCLGYGDCVKACAFSAMTMEDGVAKTLEDRCTACGSCVAACPRGVIKMLPVGQTARVLCQTKLPMRSARSLCKAACIRCQLCVKNCPQQALRLENDAIVVDEQKCNGCRVCTHKCPMHCLAIGELPH